MHGNEQLAIIIPKLREIGAQITPDQLDFYKRDVSAWCWQYRLA